MLERLKRLLWLRNLGFEIEVAGDPVVRTQSIAIDEP